MIMSRLFLKTILFVLCLVCIGSVYKLILNNRDDVTVSVDEPSTQLGSEKNLSIPKEKDLSSLLETNLNPKIVKCNFTGEYKVVQLIVFPKNGATCDDFESRTLTFDNVISVCSRYLDSRQELFLNCESSDNPVRKCDGTVLINVNGIAACEYWVKINRIE